MYTVLNAYAGVGGNRQKWENCQVTAVEMNPKIAAVYQRLYPGDIVIIGDAHQYLLDHHEEYDFVWSSPACQTHSKMNKFTRHKLRRYPNMQLYEEIIFLQNFYKGVWVVENVVPYYGVLEVRDVIITKVGRHVIWSNFEFEAEDVKRPDNFINMANLAGKKALQDWLGIHYEENIYYDGNHCPAQILRNCVHPLLGEQIFNSMRKSHGI